MVASGVLPKCGMTAPQIVDVRYQNGPRSPAGIKRDEIVSAVSLS